MKTAKDVMVAGVTAGLANGWSMNQSIDVTIAAMIQENPALMRELIGQFESGAR